MEKTNGAKKLSGPPVKSPAVRHTVCLPLIDRISQHTSSVLCVQLEDRLRFRKCVAAREH